MAWTYSAKALAIARVGVGISCLVVPKTTAALLGIDSSAAAIITRLCGARELALGINLWPRHDLSATRHGYQAQTGILADNSESSTTDDNVIDEIAEAKRLKFALYQVALIDATDIGIALWSQLGGGGSVHTTLSISMLGIAGVAWSLLTAQSLQSHLKQASQGPRRS